MEELKDGILERLGFAAIYGLTVAELTKFSQELYKKIEAARVSDVAAPSETQGGEVPALLETQSGEVPAGSVCETDEWKQNLWSYLTTLPQIETKSTNGKIILVYQFRVGYNAEDNHLSLAELEALPLPPSDEDFQDAGEDAGEDADGDTHGISTRSSRRSKSTPKPNTEVDISEKRFQPRVFAAEEIIWQTITGHGPDLLHVPWSEYQALCAISAAGKSGIDQPSLLKMTGQDNRSLPRRTYALEAKGYIEKRPVITAKCYTSFLKLKKFVDEEMANGTHYSFIIKQPISIDNLDPVPGYEYWTGKVFYEDAFMQRMIDLVETWGTILHDDAKKKMGVKDSKYLMKMFSKRYRMLCSVGIVEDIQAILPGSEHARRSIRFLRKATDVEWTGFMKRSTREAPAIKKAKVKAKSNAIRIRKSRAKVKTPKRSPKEQEVDEDDDSCDSEKDTEIGSDDEDEQDDLEPVAQKQGNQENIGAQGIDDSQHDEVIRTRLGSVSNAKNVDPRSSTGEILGGAKTDGRRPVDNAALVAGSSMSSAAGGIVNIQRGLDEVSPAPTRAPAADDSLTPPKRKRGRPKKNSVPQALDHEVVNTQSETRTRKPGRNVVQRADRPREAHFISYDDLQIQNGAAGVYINPTGSKYSTKKHNVMVAVFKTKLLKTWVPKKVDELGEIALDGLSRGAPAATSAASGNITQTSAASSAGPIVQGTPMISTAYNFFPTMPTSGGQPSGAYQSPYASSQTISAPAAQTAPIASASMSQTPTLLPSIEHTNGSSSLAPEPMDLDVVDDPVHSPATADQNSSSRSRPAKIISEPDLLEQTLSLAAGLVLPDETDYILALWNDRPGKLCLPDNKKIIVFFAAQTTVPIIPTLEIEISSIAVFPTVSSTPAHMGEFLIKGKDETYTFSISRSDDTLSTANIMRARIVTAMIAEQRKGMPAPAPAPITGDGDKPYQCEHCLKRWKNDNGLLYHQTKAKTACNPNYRPEEHVKTPRPVSQVPDTMDSSRESEARILGAPSNSAEASQSSNSNTVVEDRQTTPVDDDIFGDTVFPGLKRKAGHVSEDSDFVPDETEDHVSKKQKANSPNKKDSSPKASIAGANDSRVNSDVDMDWDTDDLEVIAPKPEATKGPKGRSKKQSKKKSAPAPGSIMSLKTILLDLIESNGGFFPGDETSVWVAVAGASQKKYPGHPLPTRRICNEAIRMIVSGKRMFRDKTMFRARDGTMAAIDVLVQRTGELDDDALDNLKRQIKHFHPDPYLPSEFKPSDSLLDELEKLEAGEEERKKQIVPLTNAFYAEQAAQLREKIGNELHISDERQSALDGDFEEEHFTPPVSRKRRRSDLSDQVQNESSKQRKTDRSDQVQNKDASKVRRLRSKDSELPGDEIEEQLVNFLQNPVTGCWDIPVEKEKKKKNKYQRKPVLPEVITFMQSQGNSTWSFQPHGHGVRPILSRPGRRVVGNPSTDARLLKLQKGHRPIQEPHSKMIAPARGSKVLSNPNYGSRTTNKRRKLTKEGRYTRSFHVPHQRPVDMVPLPIVLPPKLDYSDGFVRFERPNRDLSNFERRKLSTASGIFVSRQPYAQRLDWKSGESFTWFNPPWESESDYEEELERVTTATYLLAPNGRPPGRPRLNANGTTRTDVRLKNFKTRTLTHMKSDFESGDDTKGIPISDFIDPPPAKKGRKAGMSPEVENRFIVTQIAIFTIAGGVGKICDNVLVGKLFPGYTLRKIRETWKLIKKTRGKELPIIERRFQEAFLEGYEGGELPSVDYEDLVHYDWEFVVDWYLKKYPLLSGAVMDGLPPTLTSLSHDYEIEDMRPSANWRDEYVGTQTHTSRAKRYQISTQDQLTTSLHPVRSSTLPDEAEIARSVVRASVGTSRDTFIPEVADAKLQKIGEAQVTIAKDQLFENKSISHRHKGKAIPSQPYQLTEAFVRPLQKQGIRAATYAEARQYKKELDAKFKLRNSVKLDRKQSNGTSLVITNLLAHGRIRILQSRVPMSKFGLLQGSYETNGIDKSQLLFNMEIEPTDSYIYNDQLNLLYEPPQAVGDAIPAWQDVNNCLKPEFWQKIQEAVFAALAVKSGATAKELAKTFYPALAEWELQVLLDWGTKVGALVRIAGGYEGWTTGEWWWLYPGWD